MKPIEFTEEEIKVAIQLIDIAIKAGGLNTAEAGAIIAKKLTSNLEQPPAQIEESPVFAGEPSDLEVVKEEESD
tara:strand:+ start:914 stop:1135 length:222 start_codon:yes stop_codon:yes gene_type:complete